MSALRASPCYPAQSFAALLRLQEIFMKIDLRVETNCTKNIIVYIWSFFSLVKMPRTFYSNVYV